MKVNFLERMTDKLIELKEENYLFLTSESSIMELYKDIEKLHPDKIDSINVENSKSRGLSVNFVWRGVNFRMLAI